MYRRLKLESLEERRLMAGLPYGATAADTGDFMLGRIAVTPVFVESNGLRDVSTEDWTESQKASVLTKIETGLQWWEQLLAKKSSVHTLDFVLDRTFIDAPFQSQYEPIARRSDDYALWVDEFLVSQGYAQSVLLEENVRAFNHAQRLKLQTDWSFTIFVVNSEQDSDGMFAANSSFSRAFSFAGGLFEVIPSTRPASTFAHETGHMFWARDEYIGGSNYYQRRGYYNAQNTNALDLNPNPAFVQEDSIMSDGLSLQRAYEMVTTANATLAQLGWQDSDNDGIFDVLDVPLQLEAVGRFDAVRSEYVIEGSAEVQTLPNMNSSGKQNDITLNRIGRIEYRINSGTWQTLVSPNDTSVRFDVRIPVPAGTLGEIEVRAIDPRIGVVSQSFRGLLTAATSTTETNGVHGFAWNDLNQDGVWQSLESGVAGATVRLLTRAGNLARMQTVIRPDDLPLGRVSNPIQGATITAIGMDTDGKVAIEADVDAQLGARTFRPYAWSTQNYRETFQGTDTQLKVAFAAPTNAASVHVIAAENNAVARLDAMDSSGRVIARMESDELAAQYSVWLEVKSERPISTIVAYGHNNSRIKIDQVRYGMPGEVTTDSQGAFQFPFVATGEYSVRMVPASDFQTVAPSNGVTNISVGSLVSNVRTDFSIYKLASPWQNQSRRHDVNNDSLVTVLDVLVVINEINRNGARQLADNEPPPPPFFDVDGNRVLEALDVLIVINYINAQLGSGEGESNLTDLEIDGDLPVDWAMASDEAWWTERPRRGQRRT